MKAYKGFEPDLTCRGYQYVEGETHVHDGDAVICVSGFHACTAPLDVLAYYPPATSVYRIVELDDAAESNDGDSKVTAKRLSVGASINLAGLAKAHVEYVRENADTSKPQTVVGDTATNTGDRSAATNTGYGSAATNTGYRSAATNTGYGSAATNTGYGSAATNTGDRSAATNTGYGSAATVEGKESVAIVTGKDSTASGALGCWLVLTERDDDRSIVEVRAVKVDGTEIKPGVMYRLRGGQVVEATS